MSGISAESDVDDSVTSALPEYEQDLQNVMVIPGRLVFDNMLRQLGLPAAQYEQTAHDDSKISVTVAFHTPGPSNSASPTITTKTGIKTVDIALAEHTAAAAAIRYMETTTGTIIGDLSYGRLRELDEENGHLRNRVKGLKQLLEKRDDRTKKLARGWFWSVRKMFSFSAQFRNIAVIANFGGQKTLRGEIRAAFGTIYEAAQELELESRKLERKLEQARRS